MINFVDFLQALESNLGFSYEQALINLCYCFELLFAFESFLTSILGFTGFVTKFYYEYFHFGD